MSLLQYTSTLFLVFFLKNVVTQNIRKNVLVTTLNICQEISKSPLLTRAANSSMHCVHCCIKDVQCGASVFNPLYTDPKLSGFCHLFDSLTETIVGKCAKAEDPSHGWAYIVEKPLNCKDAFGLNIQKTSGIVDLKGIGKHYCKMDMKNCSRGVWTLAAKIDGNKNTFTYTSPIWTNSSTYNVEKCLADISSREEGKFPAFTSLPFEKICLEMKRGSDVRGIELPLKEESLQKLFDGGQHISTQKGRDAWRYLVANSSLQATCDREGVNVQIGLSVRLGILTDDFFLCTMSDSVIGVGISSTLDQFCHTPLISFTSGNAAKCSADNGDRQLSTISYIYII